MFGSTYAGTLRNYWSQDGKPKASSPAPIPAGNHFSAKSMVRAPAEKGTVHHWHVPEPLRFSSNEYWRDRYFSEQSICSLHYILGTTGGWSRQWFWPVPFMVGCTIYGWPLVGPPIHGFPSFLLLSFSAFRSNISLPLIEIISTCRTYSYLQWSTQYLCSFS